MATAIICLLIFLLLITREFGTKHNTDFSGFYFRRNVLPEDQLAKIHKKLEIIEGRQPRLQVAIYHDIPDVVLVGLCAEVSYRDEANRERKMDCLISIVARPFQPVDASIELFRAIDSNAEVVIKEARFRKYYPRKA